MSLITETLKKMKKENEKSTENDNEILAPPALRNAIVNTKKYREFVKNAELKDINGNKAPLKGFVLFSILLLVVIGVTAAVFLNKSDSDMINKAGVVAQENVDNQLNTNNTKPLATTTNNKQSLGRPYGSSEPIPKGEVTSSNKINNNMTNNVANNQPSQKNNTITNKDTLTKMQPTPKQSVNKIQNKPTTQKNNTTQSMPSNVILPNQLFAIPPSNNNMEKDKVDPTPTKTNNKTIESSIHEKDKKAEVTSNTTGNTKSNNITTPNINNNKNITSSKDGNVALSPIDEVQTIKSNDKLGTVAASTTSLYNQYIATGNKAKNEGAYNRAIEYYTNALALNKTDELSINIALMYIKLKNPNMAFQVSVKNGVENTTLLSQLAVIMIQQKYYLEANKVLQYANTFERSSDILLATGYLNQSQNKLDDAIKYYNEALSVDGTNINAMYYAGLCYEMQGKNEEAKNMYKKIISSKAEGKLKTYAQKKLSSL